MPGLVIHLPHGLAGVALVLGLVMAATAAFVLSELYLSAGVHRLDRRSIAARERLAAQHDRDRAAASMRAGRWL